MSAETKLLDALSSSIKLYMLCLLVKVYRKGERAHSCHSKVLDSGRKFNTSLDEQFKIATQAKNMHAAGISR